MVSRQREGLGLADFQRRDAAGHFLAQRTAGRAQHELAGFLILCRRIGVENKAFHPADIMPLDDHIALARHRTQQILFRGRVEAADQLRGTPVHEALGQALMQRVAHHILGGAGLGLEFGGIPHPIGAGGNVAPGADTREPGHQRIKVTLGIGGIGDLCRQPIFRQRAVFRHVAENPATELRVAVIGQLAEIRHLAGFPQRAHPAAAGGEAADIALTRQHVERDMVRRVMALGQASGGRRRGQAVQQRIHACEVEIGVAPGQGLQRLELMALDLLDHVFRQGHAIAGAAEGPIAHATAGAAGDLGGFLRVQRARRMAVKLVQRGEGHMVHIHVQAHANGIGRHQEIHLAVLI